MGCIEGPLAEFCLSVQPPAENSTFSSDLAHQLLHQAHLVRCHGATTHTSIPFFSFFSPHIRAVSRSDAAAFRYCLLGGINVYTAGEGLLSFLKLRFHGNLISGMLSSSTANLFKVNGPVRRIYAVFTATSRSFQTHLGGTRGAALAQSLFVFVLEDSLRTRVYWRLNLTPDQSLICIFRPPPVGGAGGNWSLWVSGES